MPDQNQASEIIQRKIDKLVQEKSLLNSRLNTLNRENNPNSKTRSQKHCIEQIENIRRRLVDIDSDLHRQRYHLSRTSGFSNQLISKSSEQPKITSDSCNKYKNLEEFINLSSEKMFDTPPPERQRVVHSPPPTLPETVTATNIPVTSSTADMASNTTTSTPKSIIRPPSLIFSNNPIKTSGISTFGQKVTTSIPSTTIPSNTQTHGNQHRFDFPPTYESAEHRAIRLERERIMREEFDYNLLAQNELFATDKNDILKTQFKPQSKSIDVDDDFTPTNVNKQEQKLNNLSRESKDNTWNEDVRHFAAYRATPERKANQVKRQTSFDSMRAYHSQSDDELEQELPRRSVRFNIPPLPTQPQRHTNLNRSQHNNRPQNNLPQRNENINLHQNMPPLFDGNRNQSRNSFYAVCD